MARLPRKLAKRSSAETRLRLPRLRASILGLCCERRRDLSCLPIQVVRGGGCCVCFSYFSDMKLDIIYEDDDVVVLNKPKGVVMHPSRESGRNFTDSLCSGLIARYGTAGLSGSEDGTRPGVVHRLDAETSGVVVVARTDAALAHLQSQFATEKKDMERVYVALVAGGFGRQGGKARGTVDAPIGRHPKHGTKRCVREAGDALQSKMQHVKQAVTHW